MDAKPVVVGGGLRRSKILSSAVPGWSMRLTSHPGVTTAANLINLRRASTARVMVVGLFVPHSVCLSVTTFSVTTCKKWAKE